VATRSPFVALARQYIVPTNGKIADITHADTNKHLLTLAAALGETRKIIAVQLWAFRQAGAGEFRTYPNEGLLEVGYVQFGPAQWTVIADGTQRLQYSLSVANDDWDLYCIGYMVET